jgi:hypothetical protein
MGDSEILSIVGAISNQGCFGSFLPELEEPEQEWLLWDAQGGYHCRALEMHSFKAQKGMAFLERWENHLSCKLTNFEKN